jgi:hypothetical protein
MVEVVDRLPDSVASSMTLTLCFGVDPISSHCGWLDVGCIVMLCYGIKRLSKLLACIGCGGKEPCHGLWACIVQDSEAKLQMEGLPNVEACAKTGIARKSKGPDSFGESRFRVHPPVGINPSKHKKTPS